MKILTWNVNGIRALKIKLKPLFDSLDADIICLQETKVTRDMLDEQSAIVEGYNSYFAYSRKKTGYSGVATFCKDACAPLGAEEGLSGVLATATDTAIGHYGNLSDFSTEELESLDGEGRAIITKHLLRLKDGREKELALINVYVPRAPEEDVERHDYKLRFMALLQTRAEALLDAGIYVTIVGDLNTTHKAIDHCDPQSAEFRGLPSRRWLNQMLFEEDNNPDLEPVEDRAEFRGTTEHTVGGLVCDSFRYFHRDAERVYTQWSTETSARLTNYGKRLDYILPNEEFLKACFIDCIVLPDVEGSDHCPVKAELDCICVTAPQLPPLCTKFMPQFSGRQQKLSSFFTKAAKPAAVPVPTEAVVVLESDSDEIHSSSSQEKKEIEAEDVPSASTTTLKRKLPSTPPKQAAKLQKKDSKKQDGPKQSSLLSFFKTSPSKAKSESESRSGDRNVNPVENHSNSKTASAFIKMGSSTRNAGANSTMGIATGRTDTNSKGDASSDQTDSPVADDSDKGDESEKSSQEEESAKSKFAQAQWKNLLGGPPPPPLCTGHSLPCKLFTVKKAGPNKGKQFYTCSLPEGHKGDKNARCGYFKWVDTKKSK